MMTSGSIRWMFVAATLLLATAASRAQEAEVTATVGADTVGVQDQFQLTVTVSGRDSGSAETPRLPRMDGFRVVAGPSVNTQFQWVNGRMSSSRSYVYILLPDREGEFTIDPIEVPVGGKVLRTRPVTVRVTAASAAPPRAQPRTSDPFWDDDPFRRRQREVAGEDVFVTAEIDRGRAYPGEQVTLTYKVYTRVGVLGLQLQESPPLNGFWVEDLEVDPNPRATRRVIDGREYNEYFVKKQALFPNAPGSLRIPPATFAISVRAGGEFLSLFGQPETIYRKTRELTLEVRPLPLEGRPADFNNAVGALNLTAHLDKTEVAAGDAVALRVRLSGRGNLKMISEIPIPPLPDFTIYSSRNTESVRAFEGDRIGGDKMWEYVLIPRAPGLQTVPSISFSYFDADREKYATVRTAPMTLDVARGEGSGITSALSGIGKQTVKRQGSDIHFIKLGPASLEATRAPFYLSPWYWVLAGLPVLLNVGAWIYRREQVRQSADTVVARRRRARRAALGRLKAAVKSGRKEARRFYDGAAAALSGYLSDRFGLPEIAVTGDSLERTLRESGVEGDLRKETLACLGECDYGRFVSASESPEKMRDLAGRIRKIVDAMERT